MLVHRPYAAGGPLGQAASSATCDTPRSASSIPTLQAHEGARMDTEPIVTSESVTGSQLSRPLWTRSQEARAVECLGDGDAEIRAAVIELGHEALEIVARHAAGAAELHGAQLTTGHQLVHLRLADGQPLHDIRDLQQDLLHPQLLGSGSFFKRAEPIERTGP